MEHKFIRDTLIEKGKDVSKGIWRNLDDLYTDYGLGWHDLIIEFMEKVEEIYVENDLSIESFLIDEIREKYGTLRIDVVATNEVYELASEYEDKSETIYEKCGEEGTLHENSADGFTHYVIIAP